MRITHVATGAAFVLCSAANAAQAQAPTRVPTDVGRGVQDPLAAAARLYDSLEARPGWPTAASEAEVDAALARRGVAPERRRAIIALMRQDICRLPQMTAVCRYYGAETIYKVQRFGWSRAGEADIRPRDNVAAERSGDSFLMQMRLLEYGANRNLMRLQGERGLSDSDEGRLNNANAGAARLAGGISSQLSIWFSCATDERQLSSTGWPWQQYRLTTCGFGMGFIFRIAFLGFEFSLETDLLLTHSRFARKVLGVWWLTGSEPTICANSIINWSGNLACNSYSWSSPISSKFDMIVNAPPASVISQGTGTRLNTGFGVTIVHQ